MQMSTLDSYQYSNNTTILCIRAWERFRPSVWKWLQKMNERTDIQFFADKELATTQDLRHYKSPMKSNIVSIGSYVWLFLTRFSANRHCLLKLCIRGLQTFFPTATQCTTLRGSGILRNVIFSWYVRFCQMKKFFVNTLFFHYWQNLFAGWMKWHRWP